MRKSGKEVQAGLRLIVCLGQLESDWPENGFGAWLQCAWAGHLSRQVDDLRKEETDTS